MLTDAWPYHHYQKRPYSKKPYQRDKQHIGYHGGQRKCHAKVAQSGWLKKKILKAKAKQIVIHAMARSGTAKELHEKENITISLSNRL